MDPGDFLKQRLFEPLGMVDTAFVVPQNRIEIALKDHERFLLALLEGKNEEAINLLSVHIKTPEKAFYMICSRRIQK